MLGLTESKQGKPSFWLSLMPIVSLIGLLVVVIWLFGADALSGASQVALLLATGFAAALSILFGGAKWNEIEVSISESLKMVSSSLFILLLIGAISGTWMISGVVPTLICYGMKIISPKVFLFTACALCAFVSVMTGSSWTTIATMGVAFIGIGTAQGYSEAWVAGAIISGAYFGDKISPLSDTTILASSSAGVPLFTHIRYMLNTTVISVSIALVVYLVVSLLHESPESMQMNDYADALYDTFNISPWTLLVPILTAVLIAKKVPALITLFLAALMAAVAALILQPEIVWNVAAGEGASGFTGLGFADGFKGLFITTFGHTAIDTGNAAINDLIATRGMCGMLNTIFLIFSASAFGGTMMGSGMLYSLTQKMFGLAKRRTTLVGATVGSGVMCNMVTGDQYLSVLLTSSLYKKIYEDNGYENKLLSRSVEDSATVTSVLVPWNSCGMTQATVLRVATLDYLPYCFFNLLSPLMSVLLAVFGRHKRQENFDAPHGYDDKVSQQIV